MLCEEEVYFRELVRYIHLNPVRAGIVFCHIASRDFGVSVTDLARLLGMTPSAVIFAVRRGGKTAGQKGLKPERHI